MAAIKDQSFFRLTINYASTIPFLVRKCQLFLNVDDENTWTQITNNSIAGYKNTLVKIVEYDTDENKTEWYTFLRNASILVRENHIIINTFVEFNQYHKTNTKIDLSEEIKEIQKEINYYEARKKLGIRASQFIKLNNLTQRQYRLKMVQLLNLGEEMERKNVQEI